MRAAGKHERRSDFRPRLIPPAYPNSDYMRQKLSLAGSSIELRRPTAASRSSANDSAIISGTGLTNAFTRSKVLKQTLENLLGKLSQTVDDGRFASDASSCG